jgi:murein DD-endopeptidase / murein LD-carboxypeptidase
LKNLLQLSLFVIVMLSAKAHSQIVTSKKEAEKKGIYSYTEKAAKPVIAKNDRPITVNDSDMASLLGSSPVVAYEAAKPVTQKEIRKGGPSKLDAPAKRKLTIIDTPADPDFAPYTDDYLGEQLANNAIEEFKGVRYRGGGSSKAGMDCSGMVYATFQLFDITLPRSSHAMVSATDKVELAEVKKGDLLFFKNNRRRNIINHVGLVTEVTEEGEVKFIHSSTSSGVIISSMNEAYHKNTFVSAGRYNGN